MSNYLMFLDIFGIKKSIGEWIANAINSLFLAIDSAIYWCAAKAYSVFFNVSQVQLFGDDIMGQIIDRIYVILGIAMLFVFAYNILSLIVEPDGLSKNDDKSLQGLAKNLIISIVLISVLPTAFKYLQIIQGNILRSNVIGNVILGSTSNTNNTIASAGVSTATTVFSAFFHPMTEDGEALTPEDCLSMETPSDICKTYIEAKMSAEANGDFRLFSLNSDLVKGISKGTMDYVHLIGTVTGAFVAYFFVSFAMDAGVRVAKLSFLEVIAPVPIVMRITQPKGGMFDKWVKEITSTFVSLFTRLAVIYFAVYTITLVPDIVSSMFSAGSSDAGGPLVKLLTVVMVILGVLKFAKDAPKLFEDLFGSTGKFDLSIGKKFKENEYANRALGGAAALGMGAIGRGMNRYKDAKAHGATRGERAYSAFNGALGGAAGGLTRGLKADYSKEFKSGLYGAHQANIEKGALNDERTANAGATHGLPGASQITRARAGLDNAAHGVRTNLSNFGETLTGSGSDAYANASKGATNIKSRYDTFRKNNTQKGSEYDYWNQQREESKKLLANPNCSVDQMEKVLKQIDPTGSQYKRVGDKLFKSVKQEDGSYKLQSMSAQQIDNDHKAFIKEQKLQAEAKNLDAGHEANREILRNTVNQVRADYDKMVGSLTAEERSSVSQKINEINKQIEAEDYGYDLVKNIDSLTNKMSDVNHQAESRAATREAAKEGK